MNVCVNRRFLLNLQKDPKMLLALLGKCGNFLVVSGSKSFSKPLKCRSLRDKQSVLSDGPVCAVSFVTLKGNCQGFTNLV